jgi:penicillin-binding protein 1A
MNSFFKLKNLRERFYPEKDLIKILLRSVVYLAGVGSVLVFLLVMLVWAGFFGRLPGKHELKDIHHPLASEVYSADSVLLGRYFIQERSFLKSSDIPESLKQTLVATEDVRFYQHHGIDVKSLMRVFIKTIMLQKESAGGGSTITQQLAKNLFPRKSYGAFSMPVNKIREFIISARLEKVYTKDELLVLYLNTIPFADNTYGVKTAADRFFSTPVESLTWEQSAVLVGMLKATHYYNPRLFPERALKRRNVVIGQLARYGFVSEAEKTAMQSRPLALKYNYTTHHAGLAPYFRSFIQKQLLEWCKENRREDGTPYNLYTDGLKIYTTIDSRLQKHAENAVSSQMKIIQARFQGQLGKKQLDRLAAGQITRLPQYKRLKEEGFTHQEIIAKLKKPVMTKVFTWDGEKEREISTYDSLRHHLQFLQAGLLSMNPLTGEVVAYVGGINHSYFQYDHVRETTKRQIGSTFKPIVYAAALERGIGPCSYISARKTVYTNMDDWAPENSDDDTYDKKYSMQGGLEGSVNTVSVKLIEKAGIQNAILVAKKMGIHSELPPVPSIALGTPSISVTEMVGAYSVFANQGHYIEPRYIRMITDRKGKVLESYEDAGKPTRALSAETAQMMVHMLEGVVNGGTGYPLRSRFGLNNDLAGKTGTTQSNVDGWFIAISPKLVTGVWVGADDPRMHFSSTALGQGAATALPIVGRYYQLANQDASLRKVMYARFREIPDRLADKMDCAPSKSALNFFEKLFKKKKKVKVTKFKGGKRKNTYP